jgi:molybdopterin-containing oxidoreductase family iron-sulfur binding subunit
MTARPKLPVLPEGGPRPTRREFLRTAAAGTALAALSACKIEELLGRHFQELSPAQLAARLRRLEAEYSAKFGRRVEVAATPAREGVLFGYGLDLSRCVGCRTCVHACVKENNASRGTPEIQWIKVLELDKAHGVDLAHADPYYDAEAVPRPGHFYMPVQCQQCRDPACVKVCPAGATWKEPDGIVVVDYDWCIGCRCCMAACPYGARRFNWAEPEVPAGELNAETHYLGNRPRR